MAFVLNPRSRVPALYLAATDNPDATLGLRWHNDEFGPFVEGEVLPDLSDTTAVWLRAWEFHRERSSAFELSLIPHVVGLPATANLGLVWTAENMAKFTSGKWLYEVRLTRDNLQWVYPTERPPVLVVQS